MNKEQLAALLNGREYGSEITSAEAQAAKDAGLVVVFGYSDDNLEMRGRLNEEVGCNDGGTFKIGKRGILDEWSEYEEKCKDDARKWFHLEVQAKNTLTAVWGGPEKYVWTYGIDCPFATFDIMEDEEKYCRGIVFSIEDLK